MNFNNQYSAIQDIAFLNSQGKTYEELKSYFDGNLFSDERQWGNFVLNDEISGLMDNIKARMKYSMSKLSLGVYNVMENGPGKNINSNDEIYLFSGFTEIGTISRIGEKIMENDYALNPAIFPNSVHHISLCYYGILKKINNYSTSITDGLTTNSSFINFIKNRVKLMDSFIIVSGEENASFFHYDDNKDLKIVLSLVAYKITPFHDNGFIYLGAVKSLNDLQELPIFKKAKNLVVDCETFDLLKDRTDKKLYCDYPLTGENPCAIAYRLAFPFYFQLKDYSLVIDKTVNQYHCFEIYN